MSEAGYRNKEVKRMLRACYGSSIKFLIPTHYLTNYEIQKHQNELRFNGVYSRDNLPKKIKHGAYAINIDGYADVGTHWTALYVEDIELLILTVLELNMSLKKLKNLLDIKT